MPLTSTIARYTTGLALLLAVLMVVSGALAESADQADQADDVPEYSRKGADSCLACHDDQKTLAIFRSKHAAPQDPNSPFGHGQLQCEACHGPGGDHAGRVRRGKERPSVIRFGAKSTTPVAKQNNTCTTCHSGDLGFAWHGSAHNDETMACTSCHVSHADQDPVLETATEAAVCLTCHQQQRTQLMKPHAHPIRQGKMSCNSCHNTHGQSSELILARQTVNDTCYDCHAELRGPTLWEHAPVREDCTSCHEPHGSNQPGMLSMRAPLLCQSCHAQSGHPSLPQDARGLAGALPSQYLLGQSCLNCHSQVHGSNHPSGSKLMR